MSAIGTPEAMEVVIDVRDLDAELEALVARAGLRIDVVFPADDPTTAVLSGGGLRLRLVRSDHDRPVRLRATGDARPTVRSPGGTTIEFAADDATVVVPDAVPSVVLSRAGADDVWVTGRAGMRYRDLLPDRWGGRYIASHIHIPDGGPVPDWVHYHRIRFQMIVVKAGWVEVVYEDQGPPFVMHAGDAVLQPPEIRHRVLHSSPDLEVIEIGCPAEHMTLADHELELPTSVVHADRDYGGQLFARSVLADRSDVAWPVDGFRARDSGFGTATAGLVGARIVERGDGAVAGRWPAGDPTFAMLVVLDGAVTLERDGVDPERLSAGDAVAIPAGAAVGLVGPTADLRLLDVTEPAAS